MTLTKAAHMQISIVTKPLFIICLVFGFLSLAWAAEPINTLEKTGGSDFEPTGIAIRGYDTVAYFTQGAPTKGSEQFTVDWEGATWRFASQENLDLFKSDPDKYSPQYGGYCAYGVAVGFLVKIEPDLWDIVDGKLYLNFDKKFQKKWRKDIAGNITTANNKFEALLSK